MKRPTVRDQSLEAAESEHGYESLRDLVKQLRAGGRTKEQLLDDLEEIRGLVATADLVMDVMDLLSGWCAPAARIE